MAFLYSRETFKKCQDNQPSDEKLISNFQDDCSFENFLTKPTKKRKKNSTISKLNLNSNISEPTASFILINEVQSDENACSQIRHEENATTSSTIKNPDEIDELDDISRNLLSRIKASKTIIQRSSYDPIVINEPENLPQAIIPKVISAREKVKQTQDFLNKYKSPDFELNHSFDPNIAQDLVTVKFRLEKNSIKEIKLSRTQTFLKVRPLISTLFNITNTDNFILYFDGSKIKDESTPNDVDIEDEDLVEIKLISKKENFN